MAGITGLGSGVDIKSIVEATIAAERAPKDAQLSRLETASTAKFTALGTLKSAMTELQTALKDLAKPELFGNRTATSSNTSALTAKASGTALAGTYKVEVQQLAGSSKVTSLPLASGFTSGQGGSLSLRLGANDEAVTVDVAAGQTLEQVRDSLNKAFADKGVSANIVNNPSTGTSQLVLSSSATGAGKDIILEGTNDLAALSVDGSVKAVETLDQWGNLQLGAGYLQQATNAQFSIDGLTLSSASNTISNAIPDVTLTLTSKTESGKAATVTVGQDTAGVTASLKKFVESYNKLITTTTGLTSVTTVEGSTPLTGDLVGDATVRGILSGLRNELSASSGSAGGSLRSLMDLGITTQKDGTLAIDNDKLKKSLESSFDDVGGFLTGSQGLMTRLDSKVQYYVQTDGVLDQRMKGQRATLDSVKSQREALELRVTSMQTRLYAQYNAMDSLVGQLTRTSDWMTSALESLPGVVKKS